MLNKKGFTIIELIVSFIFTSILAISLFSIIISYRNKAIDNEIRTNLLSFVSKLKIDVQKDIDTKLLKNIDYCRNGTDIIDQCLIFTFGDNSQKTFKVGYTFEIERIENKDGTVLDEFSFKLPFISYGGLKYEIPDSHNIRIKNDFMLEATRLEDALETNTSLYKINVSIIHKEMEEDIVFRLIASGTTNLSQGVSPQYKSYNVGDIVTVQLNPDIRRNFRVIKNSNGYNNSLVLLYDDVSLNIASIFNNTGYGNEYNGSYLSTHFDGLRDVWKNAKIIRPITADEVAYVVNLCPQYREIDSPNVGIPSSYSWILSSSYWTSSKKEYSNPSQTNRVWFVNSGSRLLEARNIDNSATNSIRPVIEIYKVYDITN